MGTVNFRVRFKLGTCRIRRGANSAVCHVSKPEKCALVVCTNFSNAFFAFFIVLDISIAHTDISLQSR
jgi:hypothetical protein